jgi:hypothetical protein
MNVSGMVSTGWYSISPSFAWWKSCPVRLAALKSSRDEENITRRKKAETIENKEKIPQGTISIYA